MAIQDTFIGNLRAARNIASGMAPVVQRKEAKAPSPTDVSRGVDQPVVDWGKWRDNHSAAVNGSVYESTEWKSPEENITPGGKSPIQPLSYGDIQRILPYRNLFTQAMNEYINEPDRQKRYQILDNYGLKTQLGTLPGVASYLQILRNTEEAAERDDINNYKYADTAEKFMRILDAEIMKFNPQA